MARRHKPLRIVYSEENTMPVYRQRGRFNVLLLAWAVTCLAARGLPAQDASPGAGKPLPNTAELTITEPLDEYMVDGINRFALREIEESIGRRTDLWNADAGSIEAWNESLSGRRERFRANIGAVDPRIRGNDFELQATTQHDSVVGRGTNYVIHAVHWQVLDGVTGTGLLLQPTGKPTARVIALPDAAWTPEMFVGLHAGVEAQSHIPCRLAERGMQVLVPLLISRDDTYSGNPLVRYTNQTHREYVYRMAFEMGRHVIGYEVQKVQAAVDIMRKLNAAQGEDVPVAVAGVGEGGLLALYSAAVDLRIDAALVSGYFQPREGVWEEPIYRNVWNLLLEFGDAELAGMIAPRPLVIEACAVPEVHGPLPVRSGRSGGAAPGQIHTANLDRVRAEFQRAKAHYVGLKADDHLQLIVSEDGRGPAGSAAALAGFARQLGITGTSTPAAAPVEPGNWHVDADQRQERQVHELVEFTQTLLRRSDKFRDQVWSKADRSSPEAWSKSAEHYRDFVYETLIGKLPMSTMPANPQSRQVLNTPDYTGYEVVLDVYPDVIAAGILLLPKDLRPGEKRPVVVCQHGLEGVPMDTISREPRPYGPYKAFSEELVKRGFIVYAPQNPYRGQDRFRTIQRKSNPLGRSLFSYIIPQHERTLEWLSTLPAVDPQRIGFYGLSYGGKTAVRVPPFVKQYALSICSADFNEWVRKNVTHEDRYSYVFTGEYEIFEWNMGHIANYAELSSLMTPRPFMVERGHRDGVAPDEWVAWEYAKVRRHYDELGLGHLTEIEFFNGPHTINGQGTFDFLHRHLDWPATDRD